MRVECAVIRNRARDALLKHAYNGCVMSDSREKTYTLEHLDDPSDDQPVGTPRDVDVPRIEKAVRETRERASF